MKKLILALVLLYSSTAFATVIHWQTFWDRKGITEWVIACGPEADPFSNPVSYMTDAQTLDHVMNNLPDGKYQCKAFLYTTEGDFVSEIVYFIAKNGLVPLSPFIIVE